MQTEKPGVAQFAIDDAEMLATYKLALERVIARLPVKNGVVDIDSIWIETSIPYDILRTILQRDDLVLPENVERINLKSRARKGDRRGRSRRRRKR